MNINLRKYKKVIIASSLVLLVLIYTVTRIIASVNANGQNQQKAYRPVTVIKLKKINPERKLILTGVVESWKEEYFSFEVPGRIQWVIEKGSEIGNGDRDSENGTVIARIDPTRYQLKLKSLKAKIEAAEAKAEALRVSIKQVMTRKLEAFDANLKNSYQKYKRQRILLERNAVSRQSFDNAEASYKIAVAERAEAIAVVNTKKAEYKASLAQVKELEENARDAELNIKKCTLSSSYKGKVAEVYANAGANVNAGARVAQIVVMNPMLISLEVSANIDRELRYRDKVRVYPSGINKPVPAMVSMKSTVADPNTHTFNLELFVQNPKIAIAGDLKKFENIPEISGIWHPSILRAGTHRNQMVVHADSIFKDKGGEYVWKATREKESKRGAVLYTVNKKYVKLEPKEYNLQGIYRYRVFSKEEKLITPADMLAFGCPQNLKSGSKVVEIIRRWLFRPGDLVKVLLNKKSIPSGFYVPVEAILHKNDKNFVYILEEVPGRHFAKIKMQEVELDNQLGAYQRIKSAKLKNGMKLVLSGIHYLEPDEEVVVKKVEAGEL